jgi:uncharacterized protein YndB with AHSA1/START domain
MPNENHNSLKVETTVEAPLEKVWKLYTEPEHIRHWNNASDDWHTVTSENDLRPGGKFKSRMEAKDRSAGFDFEGTYDEVKNHEKIAYTLSDGRKVEVDFKKQDDSTVITEVFEAEKDNPADMQRDGWQAILENFKKYAEGKNENTPGFTTLYFEINIHAPREKVYQTMLGEETYGAWTAVFTPGSTFEGSWEKGSEIRFVAPNEIGEINGMVSRVAELIPNEKVSLEHIGFIQNGEEITEGKEVAKWSGAKEVYMFQQENDHTLLQVEMDSNAQYRDYFQETWPQALISLKEICED